MFSIRKLKKTSYKTVDNILFHLLRFLLLYSTSKSCLGLRLLSLVHGGIPLPLFVELWVLHPAPK